MSTINIIAENRKNTGTFPQVTFQLPDNGSPYTFASLPRQPYTPQLLATHLTSNAWNVTVVVWGGRGQGGPLKPGVPLNISNDGKPVDISYWSAVVHKHDH